MLGVLLWTVVWICISAFAVLVTFRRSTALWVARKVWAPVVLSLAGIRLELQDGFDLDWSRPHVFVMNHQSMMDIPIAFAVLPVDLHFIAKKSLQYVPFLGWYMWMTQMIFVDRGQRAKSVESLEQAAKKIREGFSVLVYPEGTRSKNGELQPFKRGAFALALSAGVDVVPVALAGSRQSLPPGNFALRPASVRVAVGSPIPTSSRSIADRASFTQQVETRLREMLKAL